MNNVIKAKQIFTSELAADLYENKKMGLPKIKDFLKEKHKISISIGFIANRLEEYNIPLRSSSMARRIVANSLDWDKTFITQRIHEALDGFMLGDGSAGVLHHKKIARLGCGVVFKEFCEYMMSYFSVYEPVKIKYYPPNQNVSSAAYGSDCKGTYNSRTKYHPDLYQLCGPWYPQGYRFKQVPNNVKITAISVMLWYLGDGTVINKNNTCIIRLSTDSFAKEQIEDILIPKLKNHHIDCTRTSENRIRITAKGIPGFFNLIGRVSPIKCYQYKFCLPEWRFEAKRMSEVANELEVSYNRLSHLVKNGTLGCFRASEKGRPRMLPEHIESAKELIKSGVLY